MPVTVARTLPYFAFGFCLLNLAWSLNGGWRIEVGSVSTRYVDQLTFRKGLYSQDGKLIFANGNWGGFRAGLRPNPWPKTVAVTTAGWRIDAAPVPPFSRTHASYVWLSEWERGAYNHSWGCSGLGFTLVWEPRDDARAGWAQRGVAVPWWFLCVVFGISPARHLATSAVRRLDRKTGLCAACGYDLRATPQRCPECGAVPQAMPGTAI
jgi:hypothetical protein